MKLRIFNKGKGWYIPCFNYKDEKDVAYLDLFFPKDSAPEYKDNGTGKSVKEIDALEAKYTSYKGKIGMTIFKYQILDNEPEKPQQVALNDGESDMFGRKSDDFIKQEDLPFY